MPAFIDENTQFVDDAGNPLVGGEAFFGVVNSDPTINPITIFSDRALKNSLPNPQILNADGRTPMKVWIPAEYSLLVRDIDGVQHLQELDQGQASGGGNFPLKDVANVNNLTAKGLQNIITVLVDKAFYILQTIATNSGAMTLAIDAISAKPIRQNKDQEIQSGKVESLTTMVLVYNSGLDIFEWVNHSDKVIYFTKATDIAANASISIWDSPGNYVSITGSDTITSLGTAPQAGSIRKIKALGAFTITHDVLQIVCPGKEDIIAETGDTFTVIADTTTIAIITQYQRTSKSISVPKFTGLVAIDTGSTVVVPINLVNVNYIDIVVRQMSATSGGSPLIQIGPTAGIETTGYLSNSMLMRQSVSDFQASTTGFINGFNGEISAGENIDFTGTLVHYGSNVWSWNAIGFVSDNEGIISQGRKTIAGPLTQISFQFTSGNLDGQGEAHISYRQ